MAKDKTGFNPDREQNEMRHVEVELDFTPNALASVLYRQGDTVILVCVTKERSLHAGSPVTRPRAGFTPSTACCPAAPTVDSAASATVRRAGRRKSSASSPVHCALPWTLRRSARSPSTSIATC